MTNLLRDAKRHPKCSPLGGDRCRSWSFWWFWSTGSDAAPDAGACCDDPVGQGNAAAQHPAGAV